MVNWKGLFYITLMVCLTNDYNSFCQVIEWQNNIGGANSDALYDLQQTNDEGYILGGYSYSNISGDKTENAQGGDYWVVKIDSAGNIQWQNTIGGSGNDEMICLDITADGGYILGGQSISNAGGDKTQNSQGWYDYWIVKLDSTGNIQWDKTFGGTLSDYVLSIQQTTDLGYIVGGYSNSGVGGDKTEPNMGVDDYWILKLDSTGTIQWQNTIGGNKSDRLKSIIQTMDGGYLAAGYSQSDIFGDKTESCRGIGDYWVVKLDGSGAIQWQKTLGGSTWDELVSVVQTQSGGYVLCGTSDSAISGDKTEDSQGSYDYWIVCIDSTGTMQWQNTIGGSSHDFAESIASDIDGGFIVGGSSVSDISGDKIEDSRGIYDYWILKLNSSGAILWQRTIGGDNSDECNKVIQSDDGGLVLGGKSRSDISGEKSENSQGYDDYWVLKLAPAVTNINTAVSFSPIMNVYPNPTSHVFQLFVNLSGQAAVNIELFNMQGEFIESIYRDSLSGINHIGPTDISHLGKGVYLVKMTGDLNAVCRLIKY